jgi:hypothetical protein
MRTTLSRFVVVIAIVVSVTAAGIAAQSNREDVLPALLTEVRGLRAAMEQMASAGPRVQLALGRLQLQEQRLNTMIRRVEAVRDSLASAQAILTEKQNQIARFENALKSSSLSAEQRDEIENMLKGLRLDLARPLAEVQRLTAEESSLANDIATEQARWADFNQRLEALERALGPRR